MGHSHRFWHIRQRSSYTLISDMDRVAASPEAETARAPMPEPAPKQSPDITARAVGGNRLRFRRLGFVLKFSRQPLRLEFFMGWSFCSVDCAERPRSEFLSRHQQLRKLRPGIRGNRCQRSRSRKRHQRSDVWPVQRPGSRRRVQHRRTMVC